MINQLEVEGTFKKLSPFLAIITEMFLFTEKMALISLENVKKDNIEMINKFRTIF